MLELLIVILIAGVLAMVAVPSLQSVLRTTRQNSAMGLLMNDLGMARAEAIKRNGRVLVCGRNSAGDDCANVTDWRVGWVVCVGDTDVLGVPHCAPGTSTSPNPLVVRPALDASLTLTASAGFIRFNANSSQGNGGAAATAALGGTWTGATTRTASVAGTGFISKN